MKRRINTIKGKKLVLGGGENNLKDNEILVEETNGDIKLKERTSEGIKNIGSSGSNNIVKPIEEIAEFYNSSNDILNIRDKKATLYNGTIGDYSILCLDNYANSGGSRVLIVGKEPLYIIPLVGGYINNKVSPSNNWDIESKYNQGYYYNNFKDIFLNDYDYLLIAHDGYSSDSIKGIYAILNTIPVNATFTINWFLENYPLNLIQVMNS